MTTPTRNPLDAASRHLHETLDRQIFTAIATALGHTRETLERDPDACDRLTTAVTAVRALVREDLRDGVADELYDAAHENCTDSCTGGGKLWYLDIAALLADPHGPIAGAAEEAHRLRVARNLWADDTAAWGKALTAALAKLEVSTRANRWAALIRVAGAAAGAAAAELAKRRARQTAATETTAAAEVTR